MKASRTSDQALRHTGARHWKGVSTRWIDSQKEGRMGKSPPHTHTHLAKLDNKEAGLTWARTGSGRVGGEEIRISWELGALSLPLRFASRLSLAVLRGSQIKAKDWPQAGDSLRPLEKQRQSPQAAAPRTGYHTHKKIIYWR